MENEVAAMAPDELAARKNWPKPRLYEAIVGEMRALLEGERDWIANTANASAHLFQSLPNINWVGFYLRRERELVLGPFQGRPACVRIALGRGVCGTAAEKRSTVVVADVNAFAGHIACDNASRSEIVVPLVDRGELVGVLDIDSPTVGRFDEDDRQGLEAVAAVVLAASDVPHSR